MQLSVVRKAQERGSSDCPIQTKVRKAQFQRGRSITWTTTRMFLHAFTLFYCYDILDTNNLQDYGW